MKNPSVLIVLVVFSFITVFYTGCEKPVSPKPIIPITPDTLNIPTVVTTEIKDITDTTAISGGEITDDGGSTVIARGVCWSTIEEPTINDHKTENGTGIGNFTSSITELEPNTKYYVRAYAVNNAGTAYGNVLSFTTTYDTINSITYDTIKPKNYYPIYPGSWWKYNINDSATIIDLASDNYQPNSYIKYRDSYNNLTYSDTIYVPFLNGNPIYGYNKIEYIFPPFGGFYKQWPILSETVGFKFYREFTDWRQGDRNEHVTVTQKILRDNDSILIQKGHWVPNNFVWTGGNLNYITIQEYQKYVGLINYFIIDTTINDTLYKKVLIDFNVNY